MDDPYADLMSSEGDESTGDAATRRSPSERLLARLLAALIERTQEGTAAWEVDEAHPESYCLAGHGWLVATRSVDADGQHPFVLLVAGPSGEAELEIRSTSAFCRPLAGQFSRLHAAAAATATMSASLDLLGGIVTELRGADGTPA